MRTHIVYKSLFLLAISALAFAKTAKAADIFVDNKVGFVKIYLTGDIVKKDADDFSRALTHLKSDFDKKNFKKDSPFSKMLIIDSPGGMVDAAMRIGTLVRSNRMMVVVPINAKCLSSCVYVAAGGVLRWLYGDIGIHRPYFITAQSEGFDTAMKRVIGESKAYFSRMNVSEQLANDMFATPPEEVHILGDRELKSYWLGEEDMAYTEEIEIANAASLKMSRQEYIQRQKLAKEESSRKCTVYDEMVTCMGNIYRKYGLVQGKNNK
ncbi:hypothetical protein QU481_03880 [Crenobacter sp. SG2303]|uniref:Uncharacterized protein n=1 Tax=Crenobacter oryzisoli TaxID=3056844 RepID=A0ABT7XJQ7_9NEIS|nr:hypothetical protein [Crenobacter sp. SG2303]MDN0074027.1 hypothetical protein [Crenobacter sp. SG2303]